MTASSDLLLAEILNAVLDVSDRCERLSQRLDTIDLALSAATDIPPHLEILLANIIKLREESREYATTIGTTAALAHAAASGSKAALPDDVLDSPLLERFLIAHPVQGAAVDQVAVDRWTAAVPAADTSRLQQILVRQYQPSPRETAHSRALRFQMAAVTREELHRRAVTIPEAPTALAPPDTSPAALEAESARLSGLYRSADELTIASEAELAAAVRSQEGERSHHQRKYGGQPELLAEADEVVRGLIGDMLAEGRAIRPKPLDQLGERRDRASGRDR